MCRQYLFRLERRGVSIASSACYHPQEIKLSRRTVVHDRRCWAGAITLKVSNKQLWSAFFNTG